MSDVNVLVVFSSRYGRSEQIALAAGVGAIEAEGNIRLRRVADAALPGEIDADPAWRAALARMNRDYVAPRPADPAWADVIIVATSPERSTEVAEYVASLPGLCPMEGKLAAPLHTAADAPSFPALCAAVVRAGLVVVPALSVGDGPLTADLSTAVTHARLHGRRAVQVARLLKAGRSA